MRMSAAREHSHTDGIRTDSEESQVLVNDEESTVHMNIEEFLWLLIW